MPPPNTALTPITARQRDILDFIEAGCRAGRPPTLGEIQAHFGFFSENAVRCHIRYLIQKGRLWRSNGASFARSLRVTIIERKKT